MKADIKLENLIGQSIKEIQELAIIPEDDGNVVTGVKIDFVRMRKILRSNFETLLPAPSVEGKEEIKKEFYDRYEGKISTIQADEIWRWITENFPTPSVKGEEFVKGMENAWGMVNSLLDMVDVNTQQAEQGIMEGVLKILDTEIIKLRK